MSTVIQRIHGAGRRFKLQPVEGTRAIQSGLAYTVCVLGKDTPHTGVGLAFTLGGGNDQLRVA